MTQPRSTCFSCSSFPHSFPQLMTNQIKFLSKLWFQMPIIFQPSSTKASQRSAAALAHYVGVSGNNRCYVSRQLPAHLSPAPTPLHNEYIFITNRCHFVVGPKAMAKESQEFRFGQIVDKFQGAPGRQIIKVWMGGSRVQERRGRRTFCKVMKWWQSGRGVDSRPTEPKKLATRTPRRPRPLSSRAPKLLFVLLCDVNFLLFLLLLSRLLLGLLLLMPATPSLITRSECESGKRSERAAAPVAARDLPRPATARLSEVMYTQPN